MRVKLFVFVFVIWIALIVIDEVADIFVRGGEEGEKQMEGGRRVNIAQQYFLQLS